MLSGARGQGLHGTDGTEWGWPSGLFAFSFTINFFQLDLINHVAGKMDNSNFFYSSEVLLFGCSLILRNKLSINKTPPFWAIREFYGGWKLCILSPLLISLTHFFSLSLVFAQLQWPWSKPTLATVCLSGHLFRALVLSSMEWRKLEQTALCCFIWINIYWASITYGMLCCIYSGKPDRHSPCPCRIYNLMREADMKHTAHK